METVSALVDETPRPGRRLLPAGRRGAVVSALVLLAAATALTGCGRRSVVGAAVNATTSAVSTAANVAGTAVSTTANVAGAAVSTTASATSAAVSGVSAAASAGSSAAAAGTTAAAAGTTTAAAGTGVITPTLVAGTVGLGLAAGYDQDSRQINAAAQAEGSANCLQAGGNAANAIQLLTAAGWQDAGSEGSMRVFMKNDTRGLVTPEGNCLFRSEFAAVSDADTAVRGLANSLYPGGITNGRPGGTMGSCDGFTVASPRPAWVHYTSSTGTSCVGGFGSGVTVQFL